MYKFPNKSASLRLNPYDHSVALATSPKVFRKFCKTCCGDEIEQGTCGRAVECNCKGTMYFIGVFNGSQATLAHEIAHISFFLLGRVGVPTNAGDTNEAFCYLLGFMMDQFSPIVKKAKK